MQRPWPRLLEDDDARDMTLEDHDALLQAACLAAVVQLGVDARDTPAPLPESSRQLIRKLARLRRG